jgi:predicted Zn-ribbon and HTH transcriptional regulator
MEEYNRVLTNLKTLVKSLLDNGNDAEDIAKVCWHCGFEYATSYYLEESKLKL